MKKEYPTFTVMLDKILEVLHEISPNEMTYESLTTKIYKISLRDNSKDLLKDSKPLDFTDFYIKLCIDHLIELGEIEIPFEKFGGGLKISGKGIKKLDLGGHKRKYKKDDSNLYMQTTAPKRVKRAFRMSVCAIIISIIAIVVSIFLGGIK